MKKLVSALALAVAGALLVPSAPAHAASEPTFITYNVRNCCNADDSLTTTRTWDSRKAAVANTMNESGGEIFALQEATPYNSKTGRKGTANVFPAQYLLTKLQQLQPSKGFRLATTEKTARPIIYASSVFRQDQLRNTAGTAIGSAVSAGNMAQFTHLASGKNLVVANLHLSVRQGSQDANTVASENKRKEELRAAVRTVRPIAEKYTGGRAVYLGDFNTHPGRQLTGSGAAAASDAPGKLMKAASIPEARYTAANKGPGYASFNGYKPAKIGAKTFDRVFVKSLPVVRWRVVHQARSGASDHFPVKVQLRF